MPHDIIIRTAPLPVGEGSGAIVVYAGEGTMPTGAGAAIWAGTGLDWAAVSASGGFKGKQGNVLDLLGAPGLGGRRLLVLGSGKPPEPGTTAVLSSWMDRGGSLAGKLAGLRIEKAAIVLDGPDATPEGVAELAAGLRLRHYRFDKYKSRKPDDAEPTTLEVTLHVANTKAVDKAIADRQATTAGTLLARELINEPANVLGPDEFVAAARKLEDLGVSVEVLGPEEMAGLGMNALVAVARGSVRPARLVVMRWENGRKGEPPLSFIGKGVVFDSGGISIKPAANMEEMKGDMGGAAAVVGLMHALATRKARVNAIGVVGLVENMPDGNSMRPGDIVRAMSGTTIEIVNTDAEGRLVLADALWYTQDRFKPRFMINLATLTGAIVVALGQDHAGLFCNSEDLATRLRSAGHVTGEKLWRMPLGPNYEKLIESKFADIKNSAGRPASAITAAHFLQRFVNNVPWAHLDIAGVAFGAPNSETNASWAAVCGGALLDRLVRDNYEV